MVSLTAVEEARPARFRISLRCEAGVEPPDEDKGEALIAV